MKCLPLKLLSASYVETAISLVRWRWNFARPCEAQCLIKQLSPYGSQASLLQAELLPKCWAQIKMGIQSPKSNLVGILPSLLTCMLPYARTRLPEITSAEALCRSSSFLKYPSSASHRPYTAANTACNSCRDWQLWNPAAIWPGLEVWRWQTQNDSS